MPVLTVHAGRSEAGQQAAASHTAAIATPLVSREALFEQAGIIATPSFGELIEATALLATQPPPVGRTVAIVSNVGGAGVLAADACTDLGLAVHHPRGQTEARLHALVPDGGAVDRAGGHHRHRVRATTSARCSRLLAADEDVDAIIALVLPTGATGDLVAAIAERRQSACPLAAVVLNQPEAVRLLDAKSGKVPAYAYPEAAAGRAGPRRQVRGVARRRRDTAGGTRLRSTWTPSGGRDARDRAVPRAEAARRRLAAARRLHRARCGCTGYRLASEPGPAPAPITGGTEVIIGVQDDQMFGPLVVFGLGGVATEVLADHAARLAPLTEADADTLINSIRSAPLLHGHRGSACRRPPARCATCCCGYRGSPMTCRRSPSSTSTRSSPASSARSRSTRGSGSRRRFRRIHSCVGCG